MSAIRPDNIPLPNLPFWHKVGMSVLLVLGVGIFATTWVYVISIVYLSGNGSSFGVQLGTLAWNDFGSYERAVALHLLGMLLLLSAAFALLKKTSMRRRVKKILVACAATFALLDASAWAYAPSCSSSNMYVSVIGVISAVPLVFLTLVPLVQMWVFRRWRSLDGKPKRVVLVGGGFAGLYVALGLNRVLGYSKELEIVVLDKNNYFLFPPLLPSAAVGTIETRQVCYPFRRIFETTNVIFRKVEVSRIDPNTRQIFGKVEVSEDPVTGALVVRETELSYDYLVVAPGSLTQTFGTKGAEDHAFFMRELNDAVVLRNQVIDCFERAAVLDSREEQKELLTFAVVGGGPTGVETATEIYDLIHGVLLKRYPELDSTLPEVCIIQSGKQLLPGWDAAVVAMVEKQLAKMKITLQLGPRVSAVGPHSVVIGDSKVIRTGTVVWAAGVKPSSLLSNIGLPLESSGRIAVNGDLRVASYDNVFVLGDAAHLVDQKTAKPLPPLGQVAFQQGAHAAKSLVQLLSGAQPKPFRYFDFGGLVSVGEHFAAVNLLGIKFSGFIGWFIWRTLYLGKIVGVSNKIRILLDWTLDLLIERSIAQIRPTVEQPRPHTHELQPVLQPQLTGNATASTVPAVTQ